MSLEHLVSKLGSVRIIPHRTTENAAMNLAIDRVLLRQVERTIKSGRSVEPIIRTHQYSKSAVVLGCNQKKDGYFDESLAVERGVELTIRDSGGGHMYFSPEDLQFAFIAPKGIFGHGDHIENYQRVNGFFVEALRRSGYLQVCLGNTSIRMNNDSGDNKIVAGTARRYSDHALLQQGGILVGDYSLDIFRMLMASDEEVRLWNEKVTTLSEWEGNYNLLSNKLRELFPNSYVKDLTYEELEEARELCVSVYENSEKISSGKKDANLCLIASLVEKPSSTKDVEQEVEL